jgi:hypothetical protein
MHTQSHKHTRRYCVVSLKAIPACSGLSDLGTLKFGDSFLFNHVAVVGGTDSGNTITLTVTP